MKQFDEVFKTINYPSGEFHLQLIDWPRYGEKLVANVTDFNGLAKCVVADRILTRNRREVDWVIPFFPFAREDRRNLNTDGMELNLALEIIEELGAAVVDPHSDVTTQHIKYFPQDEVVRQYAHAGLFDGDPIVAIPDAGAAKKAYSWIDEHNLEYVQCLKKRDSATGKLSGFKVAGNGTDLINKDVIIVDDICDGGGTFIGLAEELHTYGVKSLRLAVTHGLFTKGLSNLLAAFEQIYTVDHSLTFGTNSHLDLERLTVVPLENIIERGNCL